MTVKIDSTVDFLVFINTGSFNVLNYFINAYSGNFVSDDKLFQKTGGVNGIFEVDMGKDLRIGNGTFADNGFFFGFGGSEGLLRRSIKGERTGIVGEFDGI